MTKEEFIEWKNNDVTKLFFKTLRNEREVMKEDLIRNLYAAEEFAKGKAEAIQNILDLEWTDIKESNEE